MKNSSTSVTQRSNYYVRHPESLLAARDRIAKDANGTGIKEEDTEDCPILLTIGCKDEHRMQYKHPGVIDGVVLLDEKTYNKLSLKSLPTRLVYTLHNNPPEFPAVISLISS